MEFKTTVMKDKSYKKFVLLLMFMLSLTAISIIGLLLMTKVQNQYIYRIAFISIIIFLMGLGFLLLSIIFTVILLWNNYTVPKASKRLLEMSILIIYPAMVFLGRLLSYNKNLIRRAFADLNNKLIFSNQYGIQGEDILVLTPHCIQNSACPYKITTDIKNCRRCGNCSVDKLIQLEEKYKVNFRVVTGGTLARKVIVDTRPKAIIAIACERDLISGLQDIRRLPVIAILNQRPEGPCVNTSVDLDEVERGIQHFLR